MIEQFYIQRFSELVFYFTLYSFLGWMIENTYNLITNGKFIKPNYLVGPFKPMYGLTPILLIMLVDSSMNWFSIIFLCLMIPITVEYLTGFIIYNLFYIRYWDYSNLKWQVDGHVCFLFSIYWIILSFAFLKWIHPFVYDLYQFFSPNWSWFYITAIIYFLIDSLNSTQRHIKVRTSISKLKFESSK